jgi:hypothetical protein
MVLVSTGAVKDGQPEWLQYLVSKESNGLPPCPCREPLDGVALSRLGTDEGRMGQGEKSEWRFKIYLENRHG